MSAAMVELPDDPHLIRRHGGWFRPNAHGYTLKVSEAGLFTGDEARRYLDVEGLTIHPLGEVLPALAAEVTRLRAELARAEAAIAAWNRRPPATRNDGSD